MASNFKVQKPLPEKHGKMMKKGRYTGNVITRYFKIAWQEKYGTLQYYNTEDTSGKGKSISLQQYV